MIITRGYGPANAIITRGYGVAIISYIVGEAIKIFSRTVVTTFDRIQTVVFDKVKPAKQ